VDQLSRNHVRLLVDSDNFGAVVTDDLDRLIAPSQLHVVGQVGDGGAGGLRGRLSFGDGLEVLGGFALGREDFSGVTIPFEQLGSLTLRYAPSGASRPFVEVGGVVGQAQDAQFTRTYADGDKTGVGQGGGSYRSDEVWGRAGWVVDWGGSSQAGVYLQYGEQSQSLGGYMETLSNLNPFEAAVGAGGDRMDVGKLGGRYDFVTSDGWEIFAGLSIDHAFSQDHTLPVAVDGFGPITSTPVPSQTWVEYRARFGHALGPKTTLSFYVTGLAGTEPVGAPIAAGLDLKVVF